MIVGIDTEPNFTPGNPELLFTGNYPTLPGRNYDLSPGGQRFLMAKEGGATEETRQEIIVVQNWFEELKRLVPTE